MELPERKPRRFRFEVLNQDGSVGMFIDFATTKFWQSEILERIIKHIEEGDTLRLVPQEEVVHGKIPSAELRSER